ncbi:MAG: transcription antitermination factor NusB(N utilization substance protein B) [Bacteroidales bacterium]
MINRVLIRVKVLQVLYMYYLNGSADLQTAENDLLFSLRKSFDLYHYFLLLIIDLTRLQEKLLDNRKHKYRPTAEELHPNMRLVNNRLAKQLESNEALKRYVSAHSLSWSADGEFLKVLLETILASDLYAKYLADPNDSYETDREFWRLAFKNLIWRNELVVNELEEKSIFWNDDVDTIASFTLKTIRHFAEEEGGKQPLLPMFKNEDDHAFAVTLLRKTLLHGTEYRERISRHTANWQTDRVANMDLIIMQMAIAEILFFPSIPISVSLNEYIDAAKYYSTPKSGTFINGILDAVIKELKEENLLIK